MVERPITAKYQRIIEYGFGRRALSAIGDNLLKAGCIFIGGVPDRIREDLVQKHEQRALARSLQNESSGKTARREWNESLWVNYGFTRKIFGRR